MLKTVEVDPWQLKYVPDQYKTQGMCHKVVRADSSTLQFMPDWFVTQKQMDVWYDDNYSYHDDQIIEWHEGYQKRMTQKAKNKRRVTVSCLFDEYVIKKDDWVLTFP